MALDGFPSNDSTLGPYPSTEPCNFSVLLKAKNGLRKKKKKIEHILSSLIRRVFMIARKCVNCSMDHLSPSRERGEKEAIFQCCRGMRQLSFCSRNARSDTCRSNAGQRPASLDRKANMGVHKCLAARLWNILFA